MANLIRIQDLSRQQAVSTDRQLLFILLAHVPVVGLLVPLGYDTHGFALVSSSLIGALAVMGYRFLRGTRTCSTLFAVCLMLFSAVMIQAQLGRIEMHFHIFAALALVIIYRDWLPVVAAALTIAVHHLVFNGLQMAGAHIGSLPVMVFSHGSSWGVVFLHAGFVVFEACVLVFFALLMNKERNQAFQMMSIVQDFDRDHDVSGRLPVDDRTASGASFNEMMEKVSELIQQMRDFSGALPGATPGSCSRQVSAHDNTLMTNSNRLIR